jgi:hypothetical protein
MRTEDHSAAPDLRGAFGVAVSEEMVVSSSGILWLVPVERGCGPPGPRRSVIRRGDQPADPLPENVAAARRGERP